MPTTVPSNGVPMHHRQDDSGRNSDAGSRGQIAIIGGGPAGLTAAYELMKRGRKAVVFESEDFVGGIARTASYKGYLFDMGGHRFFTKVSMVEKMWREVLGSDLLSRPRSSRIYYRKRFFHYPLEPMNALTNLGVVEAVRCVSSYLQARVRPVRPEPDLETWVSNRFGKRLFNIFFRTYTEKVWGMSCREIRSDWAAQRIKDLSLMRVVWDAFKPRRRAPKEKVIKTLITEFLYPRRGPGMMWERVRDIVEAAGTPVHLNSPVEKIRWRAGLVESVEAGGTNVPVEALISSMPIRQLIACLEPAAPAEIRDAADKLRYRDFLTVSVIVKDRQRFSDNWIYIHDPEVKVGRIQNYKSWSPEMVPDPANTCLGMEYFCNEGDGVWDMKDADLIDLARRELQQLGLADPHDYVDAAVVRVKKAYPVYDEHYMQVLDMVRSFAETNLPNLHMVGRNGMHRYNNQDHSMLTAMLAARNVLGASYNLWQVNADTEYHESGAEITEEELAALEKTQPMVPSRVSSSIKS